MNDLRASTSWLGYRDSNITCSVPVLDILFRFAHKLSQNSFESTPRFAPQSYVCQTAREKPHKGGFYSRAARQGFEPQLTVPETVVLPLDDRAMLIHRFLLSAPANF